jgi:hypothetical protein
MTRKVLVICFCLLQIMANGNTDTLKGIQQDIFLHPCDGFTAYTLRKGEFVYNQSPFSFPLPSWAWWGITDKITAEIDLLPLIGGLLVEPHLPVPSLNFRFRLAEQQGIKPAIAFETMYQHLWRLQNQSNTPALIVERESGNSWYNRFNFSWKLNPFTHLHFSAGATYTENLRITNNDTVNFRGRFFRRTFNPDVSLSIDWRPKPWLSAHLTTSYGTTFVYLDNIPRKYEVCYGFRLAPFYKNRWGILRTFRAEFAAIYLFFPDSQSYITNYLPVFPYFYWQWTMGKKKKISAR